MLVVSKHLNGSYPVLQILVVGVLPRLGVLPHATRLFGLLACYRMVTSTCSPRLVTGVKW